MIDPASYRVQFQNQTALAKFGDISTQTCHEKIAGCATPCAFCKMPEAVASGMPTANEVPLPNDEHLLVQWAQVQTSSGQTHIVETITDITAIKRQQSEAEGLVKKLSNTNRDLMQANQLLRDQSIRDSLTGLYNHPHFQETLTQLCALALRTMRPLSLLFIDLDDFKQINDMYGHAKGDEVLSSVGAVLRVADGRGFSDRVQLTAGGDIHSAVGWAVYLLGFLLLIVLSILAGSLQSLRLQFVEFFSKFYQGGGRPYVPFGRRAT